MPTFDIVSEVNDVELRHAVENAMREVGTRFDFRGVEASITLNECSVVLKSASDFQVRQLEEFGRATQRFAGVVQRDAQQEFGGGKTGVCWVLRGG